jgi:hypothetical protein
MRQLETAVDELVGIGSGQADELDVPALELGAPRACRFPSAADVTLGMAILVSTSSTRR